ncbi:MAG: hypothetical protein LBK06_00445 [Planctomycetaceae bacterium]|jgi:hypothetical protein|nr:hypothetical protein [Planctomycetaceae bacterium]
MKKTDSMLSFLSAEVNINIDLTTNVNLGKQGGGVEYVNSGIRIFVTIILLGVLLLNLVLVFAVSRLLNFW